MNADRMSKIHLDCQLDWFLDEQPQHTVYLDAFWIDQTEVTNAMYEKCIQAGSCESAYQENTYFRSQLRQLPRWLDYWNNADAYCDLGWRRLPTEAEWEKAAGWDEMKIRRRMIISLG